VSRRDEEMMMQAYSIDILDAGREKGGVLRLKITDSLATKERLLKLGAILDANPGPCEVQVKLVGATDRHFMLPQRVSVGHDLFGELKALLGTDSVS
jgi:DNA polymerase-3 subunit alpha